MKRHDISISSFAYDMNPSGDREVGGSVEKQQDMMLACCSAVLPDTVCVNCRVTKTDSVLIITGTLCYIESLFRLRASVIVEHCQLCDVCLSVNLCVFLCVSCFRSLHNELEKTRCVVITATI